MRSKYHYSVEIKINNSEKQTVLFSGPCEYNGGGAYTDQLEITNSKIALQCIRVSEIDLDGVFNNYQSALYGQITKAIFFYIGVKQSIPEILSIKISTSYRNKLTKEKNIGASDFKSHAQLASHFLSELKPDPLKVIFKESEKGLGLLKAASHLTRSKTKTDIFDRFDSLWKAFNALYRVIAKKTSDHECHRETRTFILNHPSASETAAKMIENMTAEKLRSKIRWRQLILNDFENYKKTKAFRDFVLRYTDARLMHVLKKTLPYRQEFLTKAGFLDVVEVHIEKHLKAAKLDNQQLIAALCIKYTYFVRNKSAHGERLDRIIGLSNKEMVEIKWLSDLLERLIIDLINANGLY
ncbi:hypothetical protein [Pseudomonas nunensis]|uniref:Apea-like HEPN domain-containing protein n=1 Tax=Pseudomonas nunensis TaxID=2961896 RepID=A0ABY5EE89_9PSED|nr:hypothetical protein [Pseudomonas nunensis]KPN89192.1 hypothetical protein AL066_24140 [Pseudomonas nunensis]MCL5227605.1 hypothetical protein [Pseudomonas nunensis]UTO13526.1 hypothetical protein NK667_25660 [Pseudomonas nunensis]